LRDKQKDNDLFILSRLIGWLDGYSVMSCVDPQRIEKMVHDYSDDHLVNIWNQIKGDVNEIGKLPASSPTVVRMTKIVTISRSLFILVGIAAVLSWLFLIRLQLPIVSGPYSLLYLLIILVILFNANLYVYFFSTRKLNSEVRSIYETKGAKLKKQRQRLRQTVQQLIEELRQRARSYGYETEGYEFTVFNRDYRNIKVIKQRGNKYQAIVK
jgi:hypothetical protein